MMKRTGTLRAPAVRAALVAGLTLLAADRAGAQYGTFGYEFFPGYSAPGMFGAAPVPGFGGFNSGLASAMYGGPSVGMGGMGGMGGGYGIGSWGGYGGGGGGYGMSPYNVASDNAIGAAMKADRYNLMNAQASSAYQAANLYRQEALGEAANRYRTAKYSPGYDPKTAKTFLHRRMGMRPATMPLNQLIGRNGEVLWPAATPSGADLTAKQQAASDAVRKAFDEYRANGRASVASVVDAKDRVSEFGGQAAEKLRKEDVDEADGFQVFLSSLERGLDQMGEAAPRAAGGSISLTPDNAPKTGGDVLKQEIRQDDRSNNRTNPPDAATPKVVPRGDRSRRPS